MSDSCIQCGCGKADCDSVELKLLREESAEVHKTLDSMSRLLTGVAKALKGEPPELILHSWHDLPELTEKLAVAAVGALYRSCIGCAGGVTLDGDSHTSIDAYCTADPILRDAVAAIGTDKTVAVAVVHVNEFDASQSRIEMPDEDSE